MMHCGAVKRDPNFSSCVAGAHLNGANTGTSFPDVKGNTWAAGSNAQTTTFSGSLLSAKFNGSSLATNNGYISTSGIATFGTSQYTLRGWVMVPSLSGNVCIFDNRGASAVGIAIYASVSSAGVLAAFNNAAQIGTNGPALTVNIWHYITVCRGAANAIFLGVDGTVANVGSDSRTYQTSPTFWGANNAGAQLLGGYLQDIQEYSGVALHTSAFTPTTQPFLNQ